MKTKIFIIEDDPDISELMQMIVENEGFAVKAFLDMEGIDAAVAKERPGLIVLDLTIGGTDTSSFVEKMKKNKSTQKIPILLVSAKTSLEEIAAHTKADAYLAKPFNIRNLTELIKKLV